MPVALQPATVIIARSAWPVPPDYIVNAVCIGVEAAIENFDGTGTIDGEIPAAINFYWTSPIGSIVMDANNTGTPVPDATVDFTFAGDGSQDLTVIEIPVSGVTVPDAATDLVVEIFVPGSDSMDPNGDMFFIGSNAAGQTAPSFLAAGACGITTPTNIASLGFPNMHLLMFVKPPCNITVAFALGDVNQDGVISLLDVDPFVALLTGGGFQCEADINQDGVVSLLDVNPFVTILTGG